MVSDYDRSMSRLYAVCTVLFIILFGLLAWRAYEEYRIAHATVITLPPSPPATPATF